ncbi:uncharacterized protein LTR77_007764 [Saxophila tyrrhenica]|uniref:Importin N-terminal domain-containing protein n=1 Tax=Saxophila tyrrhenica TaxID=1690608 RepID=A0AAV9P5U8_9PEZI|nr:hypothetical protein LTR77_007764 [Saxophila tyrrhenica]
MDEQFLSLLRALLEPSTEVVKNATSQLNQTYFKSPSAIPALIQIICNHDQPELRQLAAVEARKLVSKHWNSLLEDQKPQLRQAILQSTIDEDKPLPRHSKARVVAAIAKIDLEDGQWTELPGVLQQAATSSTAKHREVGIYMMYTLLEAMPDMFQENMGQMLTLFNRTIQDPESAEVRVNTMLALSELALVLDTEEDEQSLRAYQSTIPHMVKVLQSTIEAEDEVRAMQCFDVFNKLLSYESAFLNQHFGDLIQFFIQVASRSEIDEDIRSQGFSFLMQSVRYRKMKVQSLKVGEQMMSMCLQVSTELDALPEDEDDVSPARSALGLLDILAESLPPKQVVVPLLKAIGPYVQAQDPAYRRGGILALGMCVEGAPDFIATQLPEILPLILHLLEDSSASVRSATLNTVARLADDLAEDMGKEHARLIPALVKNFDMAVQGMRTAPASSKEHDLDVYIVKGSCMAVDSLIEGLDQEDAAKYVTELVPRFAMLFEHEDHKIQMAAVSAVGSIASASEKAYQPYFEQTMQSLGKYINAKDSNDELELRGIVVDTLGKIATAVGPEQFQPYVQPLMASSDEGLHLDHQRLKETSYILWSTLARVYEEEFETFLPGVVKSLFACLEQQEIDSEVQLGAEASDLVGQEVTIAGKKIKVAGANGVNEDDADASDVAQALMDAGEDDDDDDSDDWDDLGAVTAVAMEKEIAIEVVGDVLTHTKSKYIPHMKQTIAIAAPLLEHTFEGVRRSAISTLWRAYACVWGLAEDGGMEKWQPGLPVQVTPGTDLTQLGEVVMNGTLALWEEEMDRACVTEINRNLAATLKLCGPAILTPKQGTTTSTPLEQITALLLLLLQKQHPCQKDEDDLDGEMPLDEESAEYDWLVIETALEVVGALSTVLGEMSGELWPIFETPLMKYASSQERFERSSAVGTMADCVQSMGAACTPYTQKIMRVFVKRLSDEDAEVKSNAAFGTGLLCAKSTNDKEVLSNYNTILGKLEPLLDASSTGSDDAHARLLDNAAGCVSRMIKRSPQHVPLEDVLPRLAEILPLKEDYDENEPVYDMIVTLYQQQNQVVQRLTQSLMPVFEKVLGPPEEQLSEEMRGKVQQLVEYVRR